MIEYYKKLIDIWKPKINNKYINEFVNENWDVLKKISGSQWQGLRQKVLKSNKPNKISAVISLLDIKTKEKGKHATNEMWESKKPNNSLTVKQWLEGILEKMDSFKEADLKYLGFESTIAKRIISFNDTGKLELKNLVCKNFIEVLITEINIKDENIDI